MNGYGKSLIFWGLMLFVACAVLGVACSGGDDDVTPTSTPSTQSLEHIQVIVIQVIREKAPQAQISAGQLDELAKQIAALQPKDDAQIRSFAELVIASGLANVPAPATTPASGATGGSCQPGDKVGIWSEGNNPFLIEVGGHGIQYLDYYPKQGVKSVSYVVQPGIADPNGVPNIAWGFGSLWEWNPPGCAYDIVGDATHYATARLDSGHSGFVVEWGTWKILAYVGPSVCSSNDSKSVCDGKIQAAFKPYRDALVINQPNTQSSAQPQAPIQPSSAGAVANKPVITQAPAVAQSVAPAAPAPSCEGVRQPDATRPDGANSVWTITGPASANVWNPAVDGGKEHKEYVPEGETKTLTGYGGSWWLYPSGCNAKAKADSGLSS